MSDPRRTADALRRWTRLRWAVRAILLLGMSASIAANVLHAEPHIISQVIAAWPSLAFLLTVELISRVPAGPTALAFLRLVATVAVAAIAAWVSYWHMAGVAARYGEAGSTPYLLPVSVDGLILIASISLIEIAHRLRELEAAETARYLVEPPPSAAERPQRPAGPGEPQVGDPAGHSADACGGAPAPPDAHNGADGARERTAPRPRVPPHPPETADDSTAGRNEVEGGGTAEALPDISSAEKEATPAGTAEAVAYWLRIKPELQPAEIGQLIGRSERTVYRHLPQRETVGGAGSRTSEA